MKNHDRTLRSLQRVNSADRHTGKRFRLRRLFRKATDDFFLRLKWGDYSHYFTDRLLVSAFQLIFSVSSQETIAAASALFKTLPVAPFSLTPFTWTYPLGGKSLYFTLFPFFGSKRP